MSIEKIHRAAPLGSRREDGQLFGLLPAAPGLVFLPARPGGVPAAAPVPSYPAARTRTIVPSKYPGRDFTSDSPGNSAAPVTPSLRLWPRTRTIHRVITQIRCGPGSCGSCWYFNPNNLSAYSQPRRLPVAADSRSAAGGYPEQFVGLSPGTSAALIPNPEYS